MHNNTFMEIDMLLQGTLFEPKLELNLDYLRQNLSNMIYDVHNN